MQITLTDDEGNVTRRTLDIDEVGGTSEELLSSLLVVLILGHNADCCIRHLSILARAVTAIAQWEGLSTDAGRSAAADRAFNAAAEDLLEAWRQHDLARDAAEKQRRAREN